MNKWKILNSRNSARRRKFLMPSLPSLFTFAQCQEMNPVGKNHLNTFTILIVCYGQVKLVVGSQFWSVLAFFLAHNVHSTFGDCKENKTFDCRSLFKVEMATVGQSNNASASPNATGVWNRLSPEEFQQLQEYTKCKLSLFCVFPWLTNLLSIEACLVLFGRLKQTRLLWMNDAVQYTTKGKILMLLFCLSRTD